MSKKDYKQGMADAMEAYESFGEKQEAATRRVAQEIGQTAKKVDQLGEKIGEVTDYIMDRERAELYRLNTPVDIADLDDAEKRVLLAVLYQLTADEDEVTEEQQNYVRAVQQYLKIYNPQTQIDLEAVENIEDISAQKAVLQAVLEFYYLGTHPKTYTDDQMDFLDCFQVNRKTRREISGHINAIVEAVGVKGLSEKYGFVAAQPKSEFASYQDNGRIPLKTADLCIQKMLHDRFDDGLHLLETQDYLVSFSCKKSGEQSDKYGFFRIGKQTGKIERIPIDIEKDFPVEQAMKLSYHIHGNMIYCIENEVNREKRGYSQLAAIDVANMTYQLLPFKFQVANYTAPVRFHISGDTSYIVIYTYNRLNNWRLMDRDSPYAYVLSKVFVMDLTQNNRIFSLEPNMVVRDAFLYDENIMLFGRKDNRVSIYKFDIKTRTETDMFPNAGSAFGQDSFIFSSFFNSKWTDDYEKAYLIKHMHKIREHYYFVIQKIEYEDKKSFAFCRLDEDYKVDDRALPKMTNLFDIECSFLKEWGPIILCDEYALDCSDKLKVYIYKTQETIYPVNSEARSAHILLGDYLYRKNNDGWYRANISEGLDNPQWEMAIFPEA